MTDWKKVFEENPGSLERIAGAFLRVNPNSYKSEMERYESLYDIDKKKSFQDILFTILESESIQTVASKTGLSTVTIYSLRNGGEPSLKTMKIFGQVYNLELGTFMEYRKHRVLELFNEFLNDNPDTTTIWYKRLQGLPR